MPILNYVALGKTVRRYRKLQRTTQCDLATVAGISVSFLGHIERGTRKASIETLVALAMALGVTPNDLLRDAIDADIASPPSSPAQYHFDVVRRELDKLEELLTP